MDLMLLRAVLGWCTLLNFALLMWWWCALMFMGDFVYRVHTKWFDIDRPRFDAIHYTGMMLFKLAVFVLNVVPYLALLIVMD